MNHNASIYLIDILKTTKSFLQNFTESHSALILILNYFFLIYFIVYNLFHSFTLF